MIICELGAAVGAISCACATAIPASPSSGGSGVAAGGCASDVGATATVATGRVGIDCRGQHHSATRRGRRGVRGAGRRGVGRGRSRLNRGLGGRVCGDRHRELAHRLAGRIGSRQGETLRSRRADLPLILRADKRTIQGQFGRTCYPPAQQRAGAGRDLHRVRLEDDLGWGLILWRPHGGCCCSRGCRRGRSGCRCRGCGGRRWRTDFVERHDRRFDPGGEVPCSPRPAFQCAVGDHVAARAHLRVLPAAHPVVIGPVLTSQTLAAAEAILSGERTAGSCDAAHSPATSCQ